MTVDLELFGQLARNHPRRQTLILEKPLTVSEIIRRLDLDPEDVGLISINGIQVEPEDWVPLDCRLCLFPPMSGG